MTIEDVAKKWVGKQVASSTDHGLGESGRHPRPVTKVWYEAKTGHYVALAEEHHLANSPEALDRRLHELAGRLAD